MNDREARAMLGIDADADLAEAKRRYRRLSKRYHPDIPGTGDATTFMLISTAYLYLHAQSVGIDHAKDVPIEVADALDIKSELLDYFESVLDGFVEFRRESESDTLEYVRRAINRCESSGELHKELNGRVATRVVEMCAELKQYVGAIEARMRTDPNDYLCRFFREFYSDRRKYWRLGLYRNPIVIFEAIQLVIGLVLRLTPSVGALIPVPWRELLFPWISITLLLIGGLVLLVEYWNLNPSRQIVPPRLSLKGIMDSVSAADGHVSVDDRTSAGVGAVALAIIGTVLLPGPGTLIGAAVGGILGWLFGEDLDGMKAKAYSSIQDDVVAGLDQVERGMRSWAERSRLDIEAAILRAFAENCHRIGAIVPPRQLAAHVSRLIASEQRAQPM